MNKNLWKNVVIMIIKNKQSNVAEFVLHFIGQFTCARKKL